jgi:hypothetical protein
MRKMTDVKENFTLAAICCRRSLEAAQEDAKSREPSCAFRDYASLLVRIAGSSGVFPIRLEAVMAVEGGTEGGICHVGPVILIEAGCVFKAALVYVKDKLLVDAIDLQRLPWYSKQLITHLEKAAKGQNGIGDAAGMQIDHQVFDLSEILAGSVLT